MQRFCRLPIKQFCKICSSFLSCFVYYFVYKNFIKQRHLSPNSRSFHNQTITSFPDSSNTTFINNSAELNFLDNEENPFTKIFGHLPCKHRPKKYNIEDLDDILPEWSMERYYDFVIGRGSFPVRNVYWGFPVIFGCKITLRKTFKM